MFNDKRIFSIDLETDGLYGPSFAAAAVVWQDGKMIDKFCARSGLEVQDPWVKENVLPHIADMDVSHTTSQSMEESLWAFYLKHCVPMGYAVDAAKSREYCTGRYRANVDVIAHCAAPVETGFFSRVINWEKTKAFTKWGNYDFGLRLDFAGPLPLHEVGTALHMKGHDSSSVDFYMKSKGMTVPGDLSPHNPLYDAIAAAMVWEHLT